MSTPLALISPSAFPVWKKKQSAEASRWLDASGFRGVPGSICILPDGKGGIASVVAGVAEEMDMWAIAHLPRQLPKGTYAIEGRLTRMQATGLSLGWHLATYSFDRYKKVEKPAATLAWHFQCDRKEVERLRDAIFLARNLINTPTNDMLPSDLAAACARVAKTCGASIKIGAEVAKG